MVSSRWRKSGEAYTLCSALRAAAEFSLHTEPRAYASVVLIDVSRSCASSRSFSLAGMVARSAITGRSATALRGYAVARALTWRCALGTSAGAWFRVAAAAASPV